MTLADKCYVEDPVARSSLMVQNANLRDSCLQIPSTLSLLLSEVNDTSGPRQIIDRSGNVLGDSRKSVTSISVRYQEVEPMPMNNQAL